MAKETKREDKNKEREEGVGKKQKRKIKNRR